jgi:carbon storage regulator
MLVLSLKKNEKIRISDDIVICVVDIRGDKVRIGVQAPQNVPVHREEVYDAIKRRYVPPEEATQAAPMTTAAPLAAFVSQS